MRVRTTPLAVTLLAGAVAGSMAFIPTTAFASSHHHGSVTVVKGSCNAVNGGTVDHCVSVSHSHRHGHGGGYGGYGFDRHHGHILEGVGDILGGVLGAL